MKFNQQARFRLFCFPYAGGDARVFSAWPASLPSTVEVCRVQLPGRGPRLSEPVHTNLLSLVKEIAQALDPFLDKPFAFFGHSMGALIGFELARELRRLSAPAPFHLFLSGCPAPQRPRHLTYNLPTPQFIEELRRLDGTPAKVLEDPELMQLMLPLLRADFEVTQTYSFTPEPPLNSRMTVMGGLQDSDVPRDSLEAWREHTESEFSLRMFPGNHLFVNTAQMHIFRLLAEELS